jgi:hypothetical protein
MEIAERTKDFLNNHEDLMSPSTAHSTRAVGDAIEGSLGDNFQTLLGDVCAEYSANFARRAVADIAFKDRDDFYRSSKNVSCSITLQSHPVIHSNAPSIR